MKRNQWMVGLAFISVLWTVTAAAQSSLRVGSLEFEVLEGPEPIGLIALLSIPDEVPSIAYQIPQAQGGHFTTPWAINVGAETVLTDTLMILTNADGVATTKLQVKLWNADGVLDDGCTRMLALEPKTAVKHSTRAIFPHCPAVLP